jgi:hypothetical protein
MTCNEADLQHDTQVIHWLTKVGLRQITLQEIHLDPKKRNLTLKHSQNINFTSYCKNQ